MKLHEKNSARHCSLGGQLQLSGFYNKMLTLIKSTFCTCSFTPSSFKFIVPSPPGYMPVVIPCITNLHSLLLVNPESLH